MSTSSFMSPCDVDAYLAWRNRRVSPAYMRGLPTWMWQSAIRCGPARRAAAASAG